MLHYLLNATHAIRSAVTDRKGVTAAEYAVLAVGVIVVVAGAVSLFGDSLEGAFTRIGGLITSSTTPTAAPAP
jgi:Flp pilus assembly pilin Flp